jgi:hypothetical protein
LLLSQVRWDVDLWEPTDEIAMNVGTIALNAESRLVKREHQACRDIRGGVDGNVRKTNEKLTIIT